MRKKYLSDKDSVQSNISKILWTTTKKQNTKQTNERLKKNSWSSCHPEKDNERGNGLFIVTQYMTFYIYYINIYTFII